VESYHAAKLQSQLGRSTGYHPRKLVRGWQKIIFLKNKQSWNV